MSRFQFLIFLLLASQYTHAQQTCQAYIDGLFSKHPTQLLDPKTLTEQENFYVQFSGRQGYRDLGQRSLCETQPSMKYYVLVRPNSDGPHHRDQDETGICVIRECTMDILGADDAKMRQLFKLNNWDIGQQDIKLYDVDQDVPRDAAFYFNAIFQALLAFLGISSTVIVYKRARDSRRKGETQPKKNHWLIEAFDIRASLKNLYQTAQDQNQNENLATFGFFKFFVSWWVVGLHTRFFVFRMLATYQYGDTDGFPQLLGQGDFSVDFFFFISGFLAAYVLTAKFQKEELTFKTFFHHMKHRLIRIWPLCMMGVIFHALMVVYMFKGPMWERYSGIVPYCKTFWWQKLLLIDNLLYKGGGNCLTITWYTSVDLQSYALVIVVVFLYAKSRAGGYIAAFLIALLSYLTGQDRMGDNQFIRFYIYTPARMGDIFIGALFGMHYYDYAKLKQKWNLYWICNRFIVVKYLVMAAGSWLLYYLAYYIVRVPDLKIMDSENQSNRSRVACFAAAILSVITVQHRCYLKMFLNLRIWQILGKLCYGLYLFHMPIVFAVLFTRDQEIYRFDMSEFLGIYFKVLAISYCVCIIYYIFFERPLFAIEAYFTNRSRQRPVERQEKGLLDKNKGVNEEVKLLPLSDQAPLNETKEIILNKANIDQTEAGSPSQLPFRESDRPNSGNREKSRSELRSTVQSLEKNEVKISPLSEGDTIKPQLLPVDPEIGPTGRDLSSEKINK